MDCGTCGSQDTVKKTGVSKKTGQPWTAYDCNESQCKNEKGYPSRTFVPTARGPKQNLTPQPMGDMKSIMQKLDYIISCLPPSKKKIVTDTLEFKDIPDAEENPF